MDDIHAIQWCNGKVRVLDQTKLPDELILLEISDYKGIVNCVNNMNVRGAPAIGIAAAFGVVLSVWYADEIDRAGFLDLANEAIKALKKRALLQRIYFGLWKK